MSRCFPFPPPGYDEGKKNRVLLLSSDALINESIKREHDKADEKERRKEKKREKKEKKKEKKEKEKKEKKEKSGLNGEVVLKRHTYKDEGAKADHNCIDYQKKKECEIEHLERSGLTEEHEQPSSVPKHCDSSDSTQNSGKRKRRSSPLQGSQNQSTMLRIRLPLSKQRDPKELLSTERLHSSSGGIEIGSHKIVDIGSRKIADIGPNPSANQSCSISGRSSSGRTEIGARKIADIGLLPSIKQPCSSGRAEVPAKDCSEQAPAAELGLCKSDSLSDAQLRQIIEKWAAPPPMHVESIEFDEQEWLFDVPTRREPKRSKVSNAIASDYETSNLWPRACYLPEAEIYALPFTVPY